MDTIKENAELITQQIMKELFGHSNTAFTSNNVVTGFSTKLKIPVGISNRHVHLSREDMDALFGAGSDLTRFKAVKQPGQYAAQEVITLKGPKGELQNVRVLGPLRSETQVEISISDGFSLGVRAPVRMSGDLENSPSIELIGPRGRVIKDHGVIVAWRHIHISHQNAASFGLEDGMEINVEAQGDRAGVLHNVVVRVNSDAVTEMHIDVEEANAFNLKNNDSVTLYQVR
ncbi:phosphate propanoyltransferase [Vibrio methylphosphonaticus]|uniref:phosphate propanoyltransferase n=1 Tax=Vibrio methylphosphonaticus TaxID=2946866 RepID=UPI00202AAA14|nr:phosphate propanoyltransferase [Vibrio methylphosphonaticus]MCL9774033.1 phosphate propanoyltransferase [Vibrio methylphosphonaticus]